MKAFLAVVVLVVLAYGTIAKPWTRGEVREFAAATEDCWRRGNC